MTSNFIVAEFIEKSLMRDFVKSFGKVQQNDVDLVSSRTYPKRTGIVGLA